MQQEALTGELSEISLSYWQLSRTLADRLLNYIKLLKL